MRILLGLMLAGACFAGNDSVRSVVVRQAPKSPGSKSLALSIVLPGLGRLSEDRSRTSLAVVATFIAADVAAWITFFHSRSEGGRYEKRFERYADNHWSVDRYAEFLEASLNLSSGYLGRGDEIDRGRLLDAENEWAGLSGVSVHHLYESGRQQYYEMIYKYPEQFALGWGDAVANSGAYPQTGYTRSTPSAMMLEYRSIRNKSNVNYATARGMVGFLLANRLLSAFDTAVFVGKKKQKTGFEMRIGQFYDSSGQSTITPMIRIVF